MTDVTWHDDLCLKPYTTYEAKGTVILIPREKTKRFDTPNALYVGKHGAPFNFELAAWEWSTNLSKFVEASFIPYGIWHEGQKLVTMAFWPNSSASSTSSSAAHTYAFFKIVVSPKAYTLK